MLSHNSYNISNITLNSFSSQTDSTAKRLKILQRHTVELSRDMNPDDMKRSLFEKEMLTLNELQRLGLPTMTTLDKNMFILAKIPSKGRQAFDLFVQCLIETSEENPVHKELVTKILTEVKCLA